MNFPKRQHIVPQFYLRNFSQGKRIGVFDLEDQKEKYLGLRHVAVHKNYYTLNIEELEPQAFEHWLSEVEGKAADVFRKIESGVWPLSPDDRQILAYFMLLQDRRGA